MPNWVRNDMIVYGELSPLQTFIGDIKLGEKGNYEIIRSLFPCPQELYDTPSQLPVGLELAKKQALMVDKYGVPTWYEWQAKHWGIKWGDCDTSIEENSYEINYPSDYEDGDVYIRFKFTTPWAYPFTAFTRISKMFPDLHFEIVSIDKAYERKAKCVLQNGQAIETELEYHKFWDDGIA